TTATSAQELAMFHGADARLAAPVRVYVGVRSADSAQHQAQLAVRELERAGGFDRKVLVVWVPTGTGWMVPKPRRRSSSCTAATQRSLRSNTRSCLACSPSSWTLGSRTRQGLRSSTPFARGGQRSRRIGGRSFSCSARASAPRASKRLSSAWTHLPRWPT